MVLLGLAKPNHQQNLRPGVTKAAPFKKEGAELLLSYAEQALWFCLGAASFKV